MTQFIFCKSPFFPILNRCDECIGGLGQAKFKRVPCFGVVKDTATCHQNSRVCE